MKTTKDTLLAIWVLAKLGWSNRRIARLVLPSSHHTVTDYYSEACELIDAGELPISAKDEKKIRSRYVGTTKNLEDLAGYLEMNECGGGRRVKPHVYDSDDWKDKSYYGKDGD